jgi:hypothetical protein
LIGVKRERHPIVAQRDQKSADDDADRAGLLCEQKAEYGDTDRRSYDLPFALETIREVNAGQRTDRRGDRNDERIGEGFGDFDACEMSSVGTQLENP